MGWWPKERLGRIENMYVYFNIIYILHTYNIVMFLLQLIVYIYTVIHRYFNSLHILLISSSVSLFFVLCKYKYIFTFDPPPVLCMYSNIFVHTYQMRMMPHVYRCKRELLICRTWSHHFGVLNPITQTRFGPYHPIPMCIYNTHRSSRNMCFWIWFCCLNFLLAANQLSLFATVGHSSCLPMLPLYL